MQKENLIKKIKRQRDKVLFRLELDRKMRKIQKMLNERGEK